MLKRLVIRNFKGIKETNLEFRPGLNILVGDNESGKSTILEAINFVLTGQLNRRAAAYELHPFLFNQEICSEYIAKINNDKKDDLPEILVEAYFDESIDANLKGTNNSLGENCPGVKIRVHFDDNFGEEYGRLLEKPDQIAMVPVDYYRVSWESFSESEHLVSRNMPVRAILIDPGALSNSYAVNKYVFEIARDYLTPSQRADLSVTYRNLKQLFQDNDNVQAINKQLEKEKGAVSERAISVGLDMTARANWESGVISHLDGIPLTQIGKGEQNSLKIKLALKSASDHPILLIEEPENHLSHANLNRLLNHVSGQLGNRQAIISTHSSFVLNKLGPDSAMIFNGKNSIRLDELPAETRNYFMKLPGHNTLRMVLAPKSILVEGPSDELVVQKAYKQVHGKLPLADGVEVIAVNSLAFQRFLDIAKLLSLSVIVVTDNDGNPEAVAQKYEDYAGQANLKILFSEEKNLENLEMHMLHKNGLEKLNQILGKGYDSNEKLLAYMKNNKTEVALKIFEFDENVIMPEYIIHAVQ